MTTKQGRYLRIILHIIAPILFGTSIYALYRGLNFIDPQQKIFPLLHFYQPPDWIKYNLPDGLWLYALSSMLLFIWKENFSVNFMAWLFFVIIAAFLSEFLQAYNIIPGTFDFKDLLAYFFALFFFILKFHPIKKISFIKFKITKL
jgi:hypothetical protein